MSDPTGPTSPSNADALIVGAGPTGLMMASQLLRWGVQPRIVEANAGPSIHTKALGVQARSMEIYRQMGLSEEALSRGVPARAATLFVEGAPIGRVPLGEIGAGLSAFPYLFVLGQDQNERILGDFVRAHGGMIEWSTRLEEFHETANGFRVSLSHAGERESTEIRYLIGADGGHSEVRHGLGISFEGDTYEHRFFVADLQVEGEAVEGELNLFLSNAYYILAMFPMPGPRHFRLVGAYPDALENLDEPTFEDLRPHLQALVGDQLRFGDVTWFASYRVHHRVAQTFSMGHAFLLGDAAHIHSPVGGQGMNTGLQDAYNLAWKLALVLRGHAPETLLATYNEERRPNATTLVNTTDRAFNAIISHGRLMGFTRDWLLPRVVPVALRDPRIQRRLFLTISQTAINYRRSRLSVNRVRSRVKAGDRFPWFTTDGKDVYGEMTGTQFTLFVVGDWVAQWDAINNLCSDLVKPVLTANHAEYAKSGLTDGLYLVRPDGYVGLTAQSPDEVSAYLADVVGASSASVASPDTRSASW
ncbi:MAG TPA: FAD-dependent monooxygenase [Ktedonobacterales bacterium]|nr:FAD-dependent monooxygenase [Ktedonobacterales bacterium]